MMVQISFRKHADSDRTEPVALRQACTPCPSPVLNIAHRPVSIFDDAYENVEALAYRHHPAIKAPVAV